MEAKKWITSAVIGTVISCCMYAERARVSAFFMPWKSDTSLATAMDVEQEVVAGDSAAAQEQIAREGEVATTDIATTGAATTGVAATDVVTADTAAKGTEDVPQQETRGANAYAKDTELNTTNLAIEQFDTKAKSEAVVRLVEKAATFLTKNSEVVAFQAFNASNEFINGELYIFVYDVQGVCLAHGQESNLIWKNLYDQKDAYGVPIVQSLIEEALKREHNGWVTYQWRNATKVSYVQKVVKGDKTYVLGSGYFPHSKVDAVENLVKSAVALFNDVLKRGRPKDEALSTFSYPLGRFVLGDLYLYALSFEGIHLAHGELPGLIGTNGWMYRDSQGKLVNQEIIQKLREKSSGGVWTEYWSKNALKKTYAERVVDDKGLEYFIACGFYPTADRNQVTDLVRKGYQYMKANGLTQASKEFSDQRSNDFKYGDLYLIVYDMEGKCLAHGGNPSFIGSPQGDMKDEDGQFYVRDIVQKARSGGGWVNYKLRNSFRSSYVEKITLGLEEYAITSGMYPVSKYETMLLLAKSGADYLKSHKEEEAYRAFTDVAGKFVRGDLFLFAIDKDGVCLAYGPDESSLIWHNLMTLRDDTGKAFIKAAVNRIARGAGTVRHKLNGADHIIYAEPVEKDGNTIMVGSGFFR